MSADLSKSKLASKDKDELTQIAQAMGGKPSSRARKADIIDLIMELAMSGQDDGAMSGQDDGAMSGQDDGAMSGQEAQAAAPAYSADPMADARAAEAKERGGRGGGDRPARRNRGAAADSGQAAGDKTDATKPADDPKAGDGGDDRKAKKNGNGDTNGDGTDDNEPVEPGNRRRRRRGRGRDRADAPDDFQGDPVAVDGVLDLRDDGYGFLRVNGYLPTREDVYVSVKQVRQFGLRKGDRLTGTARPANRSEKNPAMVSIEALNSRPVSVDAEPEERRNFEDLTAVLPSEKLTLEREDDPDNHTARIIDLLAPVGKGQRGLIVAEPGSGRTGVIRDIARSVETNHPDAKLMVLLVDERPEEVTEMRSLIVSGDVITSTFDQGADEHSSVADLTLERAKRLVELGDDVIIIFDGITRLARANSLAAAGNNQVAATGISANAIHPAKRFFGAARNLSEDGSLTILAVVDSQPGSPIDDLILDEFVGTANMELRLSRDAALQRILPAIDVLASTTRNEAELFEGDELAQVARLRRAVAEAAGEPPSVLAGLEYLLGKLGAADTNTDLLAKLG